MKIKIALLGVAVFLLALNADAQYSSYKLENYVNPTYNYKALVLDLSSSGGLSGNRYESDIDSYKNTDNYIQGSGKISYTTLKNSQSIQQQQTFMTGGSGQYRKIKSSDSDEKGGQIGWGVLYYSTTRYYNPKKQFLEFSPRVSLGINDNGNSTKYFPSATEVDYHSNGRNAEVRFNLGLGKGRIENVTDARTAVYILEDLFQQKIMSKVLSNDEVNVFAGELTRLLNTRGLDSRIKLIQEVTAIDSFLVANSYVDKKNAAAYFTGIYDNWLYARATMRESGSRISVGISPSFFYQYSHTRSTSSPSSPSDYNNKGERYNEQGLFYVSYKYEKPINLYWQSSFQAKADFGKNWSDSWGLSNYGAVVSALGNYLRLEAYGAYKIAYYPNSRTSISGTLEQQFRWADQNSGQLSSYTTLSADMDYYFSPQLSFNANLGVDYSYEQHKTDIDGTIKQYDRFPLPFLYLSFVYKIF